MTSRGRVARCAAILLALAAGACAPHESETPHAEASAAGRNTAAVRLPSVAVLTRAMPGADDPASELAAGVALEAARHVTRSPHALARLVGDPRTAPAEPAAEVASRHDADVVVWVDVAGPEGSLEVSWRAEAGDVDVASADALRGSALELSSAPREIAAQVLLALLAPGGGAPGEIAPWPAAGGPAAHVSFLRALGRRSGGGLDEAGRVALFEALPEGIRGYPPAAVELGSALMDLAGRVGGAGSHYERAEAAIRRAFDLDPGYPPARRLLASYYAKRGRSEESVDLLQEGLVSHPDAPAFHDELGYVFRYGGLFQESMARYRRAQELDGSLENLVSTQDQITKSLIYLGDFAGALASHELMESHLARMGRAPDEKEWFYRGVIHLYAGDTAKALEAFGRGEALDSASVWSEFGRGYAGIARGDREAVARVLDALERRVVVDGERHYRLVHLAAFLGDEERTLEHLATAIRSGFFAAPYIEGDPLTQSVHGSEEFRGLVEEARARHLAFAALAAYGPAPGGHGVPAGRP